MSLILSWALFPLVMVALGAGWGFLVERAAGTRVDAALLLPLGLAAALVVAGTLDAFELTAPLAVPVVAIGAIAGLPLAWTGRQRLWGWPLLAALGALLAYGAPVLLSGRGDVRRLRQARRHRDLVQHHRPSVVGPERGGGRSVVHLFAAVQHPRPELPARVLRPARGRRAPFRESTSPGCSSPTWPAAAPRSPSACMR